MFDISRYLHDLDVDYDDAELATDCGYYTTIADGIQGVAEGEASWAGAEVRRAALMENPEVADEVAGEGLVIVDGWFENHPGRGIGDFLDDIGGWVVYELKRRELASHEGELLEFCALTKLAELAGANEVDDELAEYVLFDTGDVCERIDVLHDRVAEAYRGFTDADEDEE